MVQVHTYANRPTRFLGAISAEEIIYHLVSHFTIRAEIGIKGNAKLPFFRGGQELNPCTRLFTLFSPYTIAEFSKLPLHLFLIVKGNIQEHKGCVEPILAQVAVEPLEHPGPPGSQSQSRFIDCNPKQLADEVRIQLLG